MNKKDKMKNKNNKSKYLGKKALISYSQISILILATFAFCFIIWERL